MEKYYAKCRDYNLGDSFAYVELNDVETVRWMPCTDRVYQCYQPDYWDDEEFKLILLLSDRPIRAIAIDFEFITKEENKDIDIGDIIEWFREDFKDGEFKNYNTIKEYYKRELLFNVAPNTESFHQVLTVLCDKWENDEGDNFEDWANQIHEKYGEELCHPCDDWIHEQ